MSGPALRGLVLLAALGLAPLASQAEPPGALEALEASATAERAADAAAIRAIGERWMAAYQAGDYAAIPELYTEDTLVMPRGRAAIEGRAALARALGGLAAGRRVEMDLAERELVIAGDVAWLVSEFTVTYHSRDGAVPPAVEHGRSLIIYRRDEDGHWRIHRDMDSPAPGPKK